MIPLDQGWMPLSPASKFRYEIRRMPKFESKSRACGMVKTRKLFFPRLPQAGIRLLQVRVVVAGMAHELPRSFRDDRCNGPKKLFIERTCPPRLPMCHPELRILLSSPASRNVPASVRRMRTSAWRVHKLGRANSSLDFIGLRGPNGLRMARTPHSRAARRIGRNTEGNICVCLCEST